MSSPIFRGLFMQLGAEVLLNAGGSWPLAGSIIDLYWVRLSHPIKCPDYWDKIFWLEMVKNDICLGVASKQNAPFFKKSCPKNASISPMSRIGPVAEGTWFNCVDWRCDVHFAKKIAICDNFHLYDKRLTISIFYHIFCLDFRFHLLTVRCCH